MRLEAMSAGLPCIASVVRDAQLIATRTAATPAAAFRGGTS